LTVYGFKIARSAHPHKNFQAPPARNVIDAGRVKRAVEVDAQTSLETGEPMTPPDEFIPEKPE